MRKTIFIGLLLIFPALVFAYASPGKPQGYVNDFAGVLTARDRQAIEMKLSALERSTGSQVAVVTVNSLANETIETYAVELFQEWGIGRKGADNGLLILVAPNDRQARIEIGYGLESAITDLQAGRIVQDGMVPNFKAGDYSAGINEAVNATTALISNSPDAQAYKDKYPNAPQDSNRSDSSGNVNPIAVIFVGIIILNALARFLGRTKSWWLGGVLGAIAGTVIGLVWGFFYAGMISIIVLTILGLIFDYFVSKNPPGSNGRDGMGGFWPLIFFGNRGGGNSGFGGNGFGGFGGGMSGGGGASGRW